MKKFITVFVVLCIVFSFQCVALAATDSQEYSLDALHMKISIPRDYIVVTRDTKTLPEELEGAGFTIEGLQKQYEQDFTYLEAIKNDYSEDIVIRMNSVMNQKDVYDLNAYNETDIEKISQTTMDNLNKNYRQIAKDNNIQMDEGDYSFAYAGLREYPDVKYFLISIRQKKSDTNEFFDSLEYNTIKNGQTISILDYSLTGTLDDSQKAAFEQTVKTAQYENLPEPVQYKQSNQSQGFDWSTVFIRPLAYVIITAAIGGISALAVHSSKKRKDKKANENQNKIE